MKNKKVSTENAGAGRRVYSENMKLADLIEADYKLLSILARLGIRLGFGEVSVGEICRKYDLSTDLFLLICRTYSSEGYKPSCEHLESADLSDVVRYLHSSHLYYLQTSIPRLTVQMREMMDACDAIHQKILNSFYTDYCHEVDNHFAYEEEVVFPYVKALLEGANSRARGGYSIEKFEDNHSDIDAKLSDLKSIIIKYLPESCPAELRNEVLFEIFRFEEDLCKHTEIENNILIPLVEKLERSNG